MAEAIVSGILKQLGSILAQEGFEKAKQILCVKKEVEKLESELVAIKALLIDAEKRQVKEEAVKQWLRKLKYACYDIEDVLDEWTTKMMKLKIEGGHDDQNALACLAHLLASVCSFFTSPCFDIKEVSIHHHFACKIKELNENLDEIAKQKSYYQFNSSQPSDEKLERIESTAFVDVSDICGRDKEKNYLVRKLLSESSAETNGVKIISLMGMGGIGKTTLAQYAYHHDRVKRNFEKKIWVCVSDPFNVRKIAKAIIEKINPCAPDFQELNNLLEHLRESIKDTKFLLILDDVWTEDENKWEPLYHCLKNGLHGSKIVITTRKESVAHKMKSIDFINVEELSYEENWLLFKRLAFSGRSPDDCKELEEIGRKIVSKCKGLPLATKTIGSLLRLKKTKREWQRILDSELWKLEETDKEGIEKCLFSPLLLSYLDLPSTIRQCFLYFTIFPKGYNIWKDELIKLWMAQGYLGSEKNIDREKVGEEYFDHLVTRYFFQDSRNDDDEI